jgi:glycosidase
MITESLKTNFCITLMLFYLAGFSQTKSPITRVDPPFWWNNLNNKELQLMLYGQNLSSYSVQLDNSKIKLSQVERVENPNYLFVYINLQSFTGNSFRILLNNKSNTYAYTYALKTVKKEVDHISQSDFIYLAMPDRFANGDTSNDIIAGLLEDKCQRDTLHSRHGGDLEGIIKHLDYIQDLGATALWLNPTLINNQPTYSYHGYAITDHYQTDPRFGSNEDYKRLGTALKERNMKLIMDVVPNHIGDKHWMFLDMPQKDFVNQWPAYTSTNYRANTHYDPYASKTEKKIMVDGWFDKHMPDVNQRSKHIATYLMQSYLWWINYAGIDGFRIDTYSYNDIAFMNNCMAYIKKEYPHFWSSGEVWERGVLSNAFFTQNNAYAKAPKSNLSSAIDFNLYWAINDALLDTPTWDKGIAKLYHTLGQDGMFAQPHLNMTFLDNHDVNRFYSIIGNDIKKYKMGIGLLLTMRGVPSIYYGTELLTKNPKLPRTNDGEIRMDFMGGWPKDSINKFTKAGRTAEENEALEYLKKLAHWRKNNEAITQGKTLHFAPVEGVYVYFRYTENKCVMVMLNRSDKSQKIDFSRFNEMIKNFNKGSNVIDNTDIDLALPHIISPDSIEVVELFKKV